MGPCLLYLAIIMLTILCAFNFDLAAGTYNHSWPWVSIGAFFLHHYFLLLSLPITCSLVCSLICCDCPLFFFLLAFFFQVVFCLACLTAFCAGASLCLATRFHFVITLSCHRTTLHKHASCMAQCSTYSSSNRRNIDKYNSDNHDTTATNFDRGQRIEADTSTDK